MILDYEITNLPDSRPTMVTVWYDGIIHADPDHEALVLVQTSAGLGGLRTVDEQRIPFSKGATYRDIPIPGSSPTAELAGAARAVAATMKDLWRRARKRARRLATRSVAP